MKSTLGTALKRWIHLNDLSILISQSVPNKIKSAMNYTIKMSSAGFLLTGLHI